MHWKPLHLLLVLALAAPARGRPVTFSNTEPKRDASGAIMNAHDGTTRRYAPGGAFFYHAMGYPACNETGAVNGCTSCIYGTSNSITVWSSPDLSSGSWRVEQAVYPGAAAGFPRCTYFRTQALYNAATQRYVLWANVAGCHPSVPGAGAYATATAPAPGGPFTFHGFAGPSAAALGNVSGFVGDFALLADADGSAYAILTHGTHGAGARDMYVFQLSADYLSIDSARSSGVLPGPKLVEAPALLRRGDAYYALLGGCTCMGLYGGGVAALRAAHPLGPWALQSDAVDPGCGMLAQRTCFEMGPGQVCNPVTQAQQNFVIEVPLANGSTAHVWTGVRVRCRVFVSRGGAAGQRAPSFTPSPPPTHTPLAPRRAPAGPLAAVARQDVRPAAADVAAAEL